MKYCEAVTEGVFRIAGKRSNMFLVTGDSLVLVDAGMPGDDAAVLGALGELGFSPDKLDYIFITHAHLDHVGGLAALKAATGAQIVADRSEQKHIEGKKMLCSMPREGVGGSVFRAALYVMERFFMKYRPVAVDVAWKKSDGGSFIAGMMIIETPGHSPGSLSFLHPDKGVLCTGDALSGDPCLRLPPRAGCSDYARALDSAAALCRLDFKACLFGHGAPLTDAAREKVMALQ